MTPPDVVWACERLSQLTDDQWHAAFHAGGCTPEQTERYVTKIKGTLTQGLALQGIGAR